MKRQWIAFLGGLVASAAVAGATAPDFAERLPSRLNPTGTVRIDYFRSSNELDDRTDFLGATAQLKLLPSFSPAVDAKVEARFTNPEPAEHGATRGTLLEAFVAVHRPWADLRLGRQIVAWGRADGINPTDHLTPRDFVVLLPFEDDQRFGTTAVRADFILPSHLTLSTFTSAWFEPSRMPLPSSAGPFVNAVPGRSARNTEFGARLDRVGEGVDWSLSYFHGFSALPSLSRVLRRDRSPAIRLGYDRIDVLGADFARNFGRFGFRGEIAWMNSEDHDGSDYRKRNPNLFVVVGVDRTFGDNLNLNLQYFQRTVRRYHDPAQVGDADERAVALEHSLLNGERHRVGDGVTFRVSDKWWNDTLAAEIFGVINLDTRDGFVRPSISYTLNDHWKVTIGGNIFHGAAQTLYGLSKQNRGAFTELRFGF